MSVNISKAYIEQLVEAYVMQYGITEWDLQAWERLCDCLRAAELTFVAEACAIQRYINEWKEIELRIQEELFWYFHVAEYRVEFEEELNALFELEVCCPASPMRGEYWNLKTYLQ